MKQLVLLALAACSIPDKHPGTTGGSDGSMIDAASTIDASAQFACAGQPFPTTAPQQLSFTGQVVDGFGPNGIMPIANAQVELFKSSNPMTPFLTAGSDSMGMYSMSFPTMGNAFDGYLFVVPPMGSGFIAAIDFPPRPFDASQPNLGLETTTVMEMQSFFTSSMLTYDQTKAFVVLFAVDCLGSPIAGAHLDVQVAGATQTVYYQTQQGFDANATMTDTSGTALLINEPPGMTAIGGTFQGGMLHSYTFPISGGTWTTIQIQP